MKCENCNSEFRIQLAARANSQGCKILNSMTTILTVQCENCRHISQIPVKTNKVMTVKKDN